MSVCKSIYITSYIIYYIIFLHLYCFQRAVRQHSRSLPRHPGLPVPAGSLLRHALQGPQHRAVVSPSHAASAPALCAQVHPSKHKQPLRHIRFCCPSFIAVLD